jgi:hypothetical protein
MITLDLKVLPTFCNDWPILEIHHNGELICKQKIKEQQDLKFFLHAKKESNNKLEIGMSQKRFGKDNIWDTETVNEKIIKDRTLTIVSCSLNQIDIKDLLIKNQYHVQIVDQQPIYHPTKVYSEGTMNYNGAFYLTYELPLYNNLTNQKWKKPVDDSLSYFSNHTLVFHYEQDIKLLEEIEKICNEIEKKLSA